MTRFALAKRNDPDAIPVAEQAAALLKAQTFELATKYCDGDLRLLDERWTVRIADLIQYVKENGLPVGWLHTRPATYDGIYLIKSDAQWSVHEQERGGIYNESRKSFGSYDHALEYIMQTYYMPKSRLCNSPDSAQNTQ